MKIFVTGISTEVGKTIVSAAIVEALKADYWKPIQSGDLEYSDSDKVRELISNEKTVIHKNSYALATPMSPHAAAAIDGVEIELAQIKEPETSNPLVIEGAGGLLVPLNDSNTIFDLIQPEYKVVVVSRHYLGSINHSLLTINALLARGLKTAVVFSGNEHPTTEEIILKKTGILMLGRISEEAIFDKKTIKRYAALLRPNLLAFE
ncbi:MAG: dethiobiotin synthase [Bacteroidota bacterium]